MDAFLTGLAVLGLIVLYVGFGTWVFAGLMLVSVTSLALILDFPVDRIGAIVKSILWRSSSTWELVAIPLFIWMGEIIFRTDIADRLFRGLTPFVARVPGGLLHTNVAGCTLFAAVSGSSAATTAMVGKITSSALSERKYDTNLSIGSLAGAGSLGLLIPPSIVMIVYGVLAEVSISRLFAAGLLPGLLIAGLYSGYIMLRCSVSPELSPKVDEGYGFADRLRAILDLMPVLSLIVIVLGGMYAGLVTPSEAAAVGVTATLVITVIMRELTWRIFVDSLLGAVKVSCMVCSILIAAAFLSTAMGYLHVPAELAKAIDALDLSPYQLLLMLALFYIVLGLFLDGISIVVMSLPITFPLATMAGFDPVWFGIFLVLMVELGQVTPPVGFNLFVLQGITGHPIGRIVYAALPFFVLMCVGVVIITAFPDIALWLPRQMFG